MISTASRTGAVPEQKPVTSAKVALSGESNVTYSHPWVSVRKLEGGF